MQHERAFEVLGIEPTTDPRVIRRAFVRLARIYHPDRFAGQSEDVRVEEERRMKQAIAAYDYLRAARRVAATAATAARRSAPTPTRGSPLRSSTISASFGRGRASPDRRTKTTAGL